MENDYTEIDLLDLCKRLLKKWKQILIIVIIGAVIGDAISVFLDIKNHNKYETFKAKYNLTEPYFVDDVMEKVVNLVPEDNEYDTTSINNVSNAIELKDIYEEEIAEEKKSLKNSIISNLTNESTIYTLRYNIQVKNDLEYDSKQAVISSVVSVLNEKIKTNENLEYIKNKSGIITDNKYLLEIISSNNTSNNLIINTYYYNKETCKLLSDCVKEFIDKNIEQAMSLYKDYALRISFVDQYIKQTDIVVIRNNYKNSCHNNINEITQKINKIKDQLSSNEISAYTKIIEVKDFYENNSEEQFNEIYGYELDCLSLKSIVIGGFLAGIAICCYYAFAYVFSGKLRTYEELSYQYRMIDLQDQENIEKLLNKENYKKPIVFGETNLTIKSNNIENADIAIVSVKVDKTTYRELRDYIDQTKLYKINILGYIKHE